MLHNDSASKTDFNIYLVQIAEEQLYGCRLKFGKSHKATGSSR